MKLIKQKIWVEVDADKERITENSLKDDDGFTMFHGNNYFKPIEDVYVLSRDELIQFVNEFQSFYVDNPQMSKEECFKHSLI